MRLINAYLTHESGIDYAAQGYALEDGTLRVDVVNNHMRIAEAMAEAKVYARIATRKARATSAKSGGVKRSIRPTSSSGAAPSAMRRGTRTTR